jgi:hypothetical protein
LDFDQNVHAIIILHSEPAMLVTMFDECTKFFSVLVRNMQEMNNSTSSPNRVVSHACEPMFEVQVAPVVIEVSQSQVTNIIIRINVTVV